MITYCRDYAKAIADWKERNIRRDKIVLADRFEAKAEVISAFGVTLYVDDQPEMLKNVPDHFGIMLFRNENNFDIDDQRWMPSQQAVKLV